LEKSAERHFALPTFGNSGLFLAHIEVDHPVDLEFIARTMPKYIPQIVSCKSIVTAPPSTSLPNNLSQCSLLSPTIDI